MHATLTELRQQCTQRLLAEGALQAQVRKLEADVATADRAGKASSAQLEAATERTAELEASLKRLEWRHSQLSAERDGQDRLIALLEEDRDQRRSKARAAGAAGAAGGETSEKGSPDALKQELVTKELAEVRGTAA